MRWLGGASHDPAKGRPGRKLLTSDFITSIFRYEFMPDAAFELFIDIFLDVEGDFGSNCYVEVLSHGFPKITESNHGGVCQRCCRLGLTHQDVEPGKR